MKFKQFSNWCNQRAADGCWGMAEAITCIDIHRKVMERPFWKREKYWRETFEQPIVNQIIEPTELLIKEYLGDKNEVIKNSR